MSNSNFRDNLIENASAISVVCFIVVIVLTVVFFMPGFQELKAARADLEEKKAELQGKEEYLEKLYQNKTRLEEFRSDFSKIESGLPDDPSLPSLFNYLQKAASESGLTLEKISSFSVSASRDVPDLRETVFSIEVIGSYPSFKFFLSALEKSARLIEVESFSFSYSPKTASEEEKKEAEENEEVREEGFSFSLNLKVFSY